MILGRPARPRLSTRIVVVRVKSTDQGFRLLGIVAENATETMRCDRRDFASPGIVSGEAPFLGPIHSGEHGLVQRVDVDHLLDGPQRDFFIDQSTAA